MAPPPRPHPLTQLSPEESQKARDRNHPKAELQKFLEIEHNGALNASTPYPKRASRVCYDVIGSNKIPQYHESLVDVEEGVEVSSEIVSTAHHASLTSGEFDQLLKAVWASSFFKEAIAELNIPPISKLWLNHGHMEEVLRMTILASSKPAEYVPELLEQGTRKDMKPINVVQPEGASFVVGDESLVEWQKWRFRVGFNYREGATIHDVWYDGRSVLYRLSISEMTVPYADARSPFYRKQAFDFGDGGAGNYANNLELGCDCLGVIKYFNGTKTESNGTVTTSPNVICLHEQDAGIGWKTHQLAYRPCGGNPSPRTCCSIHPHPRQLRVRLRLQI
ncbi:hypothetical protein DID88_002858 [Monilinia fructigena]|uniref:Amine oxidase n=1 Tax=Monilinia fructigena TaxID=38457 RepID=A0A395INB1_9HELO|nr:hypothetical protein DID88_002858 [Monilinia fructigena]